MNVAPKEPHPHPTRRDIVTREGRRCSRVKPCHGTWFFFFFFFFSQLALTWADSRWIRLTQAVSAETGEIGKTADSGRNGRFRPKKKVQNAPFELQLTSSKHQTSTLSHSVTHLSLSVCSLPLSLLSTLRLPCGCETLSHLVTQSLQFILSSALPHAFSTQVLI